MHIFSLERGIMVALCFLLWIGAAGLVCWALVPKQLPDEPTILSNPAAVVKAQPASAQMMLAQR